MTWRKTHELHLVVASDAISWEPGAVTRPDFNLLATLDVLLDEGSVAARPAASGSVPPP